MKNSKLSRFFYRGRKMIFSLALFLLVFVAASVVKIQAAGNVTGWLWGGGAGTSGDGTNTNVGWISTTGTNYGVNIPLASCSGDGCKVTGYAWANAGGNPDNGQQNGIGWIDFNPQDNCGSAYSALSCFIPGSSTNKGGVFRSADKLIGWARIVGIAQESAANNSGGWSGWIHMDGNYGVDITKMDGTGNHPTYAAAGADELGWIDFSWANAPCTPLPGGCGSAISQTYCTGASAPSTNLCDGVSVLSGSAPSGSAPWSWQCVSNACPGTIADCHTGSYSEPDDGSCGTAASQNFCGKAAPSSGFCSNGDMSNFETGYSEYTWTCGSTTCSGTPVNCSAPGNNCGWIETN